MQINFIFFPIPKNSILFSCVISIDPQVPKFENRYIIFLVNKKLWIESSLMMDQLLTTKFIYIRLNKNIFSIRNRKISRILMAIWSTVHISIIILKLYYNKRYIIFFIEIEKFIKEKIVRTQSTLTKRKLDFGNVLKYITWDQ